MSKAYPGMRSNLKDQVESLIIEKATAFPAYSIRKFLITEKGFSPRQYRNIVQRCPAAEWSVRRAEIQNSIAVKSITSHIDEATQINVNFIKAARISLVRVVEGLSKPNLKANEVQNYSAALRMAQDVLRTAMGIPKDHGIAQVVERIQNNTQINIGVTSKTTEEFAKLSYDEIMVFVNHKREKLRRKKEAMKSESDKNKLE